MDKRSTMIDNFKLLKRRINDSLKVSDLKKINMDLKSIKGSTLFTGVGGSNVVSNYASKVLEIVNNISTESIEIRDLKYKNITNYKNLFICSYSGTSRWLNLCLNNNLNSYLFSSNKSNLVKTITYDNTIYKEDSFISLSSTLIPMSILLNYYKENVDVNEILSFNKKFSFNYSKTYEVFTGYESKCASMFIESTLIEAGISNVIIHDKYEYCHGRSDISYHNRDHGIIYFNFNKKLDRVLLGELNKYHDNILIIDSKYEDLIINDYYLTYVSMLLCKEIATRVGKDLSRVDHSPSTKVLYYYEGDI